MSTPRREQIEALCARLDSVDQYTDACDGAAEALRALLAELERQREWKRDYCEGLSGRDCLSVCDTFGHDDACPAVHLRAAWEADKRELAALREDKARLDWLEAGGGVSMPYDWDFTRTKIDAARREGGA